MDVNESIIQGVSQHQSLIDIYAVLHKNIGKLAFYQAVLRLVTTGEIPNVLQCYCGHDCSKCRTFLATLSDDDLERERIAEYYRSEFKQVIPVCKIRCLSGRSNEIMEGCLQCPYMKCAQDKDLSACSECGDYPCSMLGWYIEKYVNKSNQL